MKRVYVIAEGKTDIEILKRILPPRLAKHAVFAQGDGSYGAMSLASTLLATRKKPVALVIDTDTNDDETAREKINTVHYLLRQAAVDVPFEIIAATPEIEAIFFSDKKFIDRIAKRKLGTREWESARLTPKAALATHLGKNRVVDKKALARLDPTSIALLQKHPLIAKLSEFLSANVGNGETKQRVGRA